MRPEADKSCLRRSLNTALLALVAFFVVWEMRLLCHDFLMASHNERLRRTAAQMSPYDPVIVPGVSRSDRDVRVSELTRSIALNPRDTRTALLLSYEYETLGRKEEAEKLLKTAEHYDAGPGPKWALANFYLRNREVDRFFYWANRYRSVVLEPSAALFRLAAGESRDSEQLIGRMTPMTCPELAELLNVVDALGSSPTGVLAAIAKCSDSASTRSKAQHTSLLLDNNHPVLAQAQWEQFGLADNLFNADFGSVISEQGFDWRINRSPGVFVSQQPGVAGLHIDLQSPAFDKRVVLFQPVVLKPDRSYQLTVRFLDNSAVNRTLQPELVELSTHRVLPTTFVANDEAQDELRAWTFRPPETDQTIVLAFVCGNSVSEVTAGEGIYLGSVHLAESGPK